MKRESVKRLTLCALFAAMTAVCTQIALPIGPVPVTLSLLPVLLCAALMDKRDAALAMAVYMAMGVVGLPVFTGMSGGPGKLFGVTGGYIVGYIPCAWLAAKLMEGKSGFLRQCLAMAAGIAVCYAVGTAWFMLMTHTALWDSLMLCVIPFLPGDVVKIVLAAGVAQRLQKAVKPF